MKVLTRTISTHLNQLKNKVSTLTTPVTVPSLRFIRSRNTKAMETSSNYRHATMMELLRENSTKKYYIEYDGFMSNHISHGLYALDYLEAPLDRAHSFIDWHGNKKLEDAAFHRQREEKDDPKPADFNGLIGARKSYYYIYENYEKLLKDKHGSSLDALIAAEFPKLSNGLVGSALHGMIHLGYGYASGEDWFVCEGLSYLHHSNAPLMLSSKAPDIKTLGLGKLNILQVVKKIRDDTGLTEFMEEAIKEKKIAELITSDFQRKTRVLFDNKGDVLAQYCHMIEFPKNLNGRDFSVDRCKELAKWIVDCAITVYAIADNPNDFFLIHGVTSAWSLKNVLPLLKDPLDILQATHTFFCALLATYLAQNYPGLKMELLKENVGMDQKWGNLAQQAIQHNQFEEEHIYKLVQVCKAMSEEDPDGPMESMYRLASYHCVTNPLTFV